MTTSLPELPAEADRAAVAFHPPILLFLLLVGGFVGRWLFQLKFLPNNLAAPIGLPVVAIAFALFAWAVMTMRRGGASIPTHLPTDALVASGPFRITRNPIYLSMTLLLAGIGLWTNSLWFVAAAAVDALMLNHYVITPEETYLADKFGDSYLGYRRTVRRWI